MKYQRSGVNYIFWALYGLLVSMALTMQARQVCGLFGRKEAWCYLSAAAGCILLLFLLVFLPVRLLGRKREARRERGRGRMESRRGKAAEGTGLVLLIAVSLALRLWRAQEGGMGEEAGMDAVLSASAGFPFASLTFSSLCVWLRMLLSFPVQGGIPGAAFLLPLYETLGILLFYPALRSLAGRLPAAATVSVLALLPVIPGVYVPGGQEGSALTAIAVLLLLSAAYLECLSGKKYSSADVLCRTSARRARIFGCAVLCGLPAGAAVFLDFLFLPFFLLPLRATFSADLFPGSPSGKEAGKRRHKVRSSAGSFRRSGAAGDRAAGIFGLLLSAASGWSILGAVQLEIAGESLRGMLLERCQGITALLDGFFAETVFSLPAQGGRAFWIPVICLCVLYIFGFFDQRGNRGSVWLPSFLTAVFLDRMQGGVPAAFVCWLIMAAMGIDSTFCREGRLRARGGKKEPAGAVSALPAAAALIRAGEKENMEEEVGKTEAASFNGAFPGPGEPIPNPLPVPRRHAARPMDYAYEPGEDEMFFDIDQVAEGDDFDLP